MGKRGKPIVAVFLLLAGAASASAGECYYLIVFGSQRPGNNPNHTHTFATFVRATGDGPCTENYRTQAWTISWMPQALELQLLRLLPECGINLDLHPTLRWAWDDGQRVSMWGPYQIRRELFDQALAKLVRLRSGAVRYKTVDTGFSNDRVSNCIHAVSSLAAAEPRLHIGVPTYGESASYFVALKLSPWIVDRHRTHDWLLGRLGLTGCPLIRRDLDRNPTERPVLRTLQTVSQRAHGLRPPD
jgi:hypothetical protein